MKTKRILMLGLIMALLLATGATRVASADDAVVPFRAYYPVWAATQFIPCLPGVVPPACGYIQQTFTPGGDSQATHMGLSQFSGNAKAWPGPTIIQKGDGTLIAANGDTITVYYEGTAVVIDGGAHIVTDGWYIVTGGTGRFEGVSGEGTYSVFVYTNGSQPNDLWFDGHLHNP